MRFRILGPLQVREGAAWTPIRAAQQRVVLAVLLLESGRLVSTERLVDEIWGEQPPRTAVSVVHGYVMWLRRLVGGGADGPLLTRRGGYELAVGAGEVDVQLFDRLAAAGRSELAQARPETALAKLSDGLALWRGPALADVRPSPTVAAEAARLERRRVDVVEERLDALLALARHAEVVDEAYRLAAEHPLRERLHVQHMLALYRCGRRAEALDAYQDARRVLVAELGLEPGQQLQALHQAILADDTAAGVLQPGAAVPGPAGGPRAGAPLIRAVVPAQLPADVAGFTGREVDLKRLDALLPAEGDPHPPALVISAVSGTAGVGKTALAVHWAHQVAERFPDGQLYVNLRGYAAGAAVAPVEALAGFLPALGVPADQVPADVEEAAGLYRSLLAGTRTLVVLDNARDARQVRPLLPGSPGCLVLVTSRDQLRGLVARDGAMGLSLDVLGAAEAHALLVRLLGVERAGAERAAVEELARLCGYLPLALRIAAANLCARPGTIADYAARLAGGDRLGELGVDGDPQVAVRVAFDHSYAELAEPARRLFRLLGTAPGADIGAAAAGVLADLAPAEASRLLDQLVAGHLIDEHAPGRYGLHDLLRRYAAEHAAADPDRDAATGRLYRHYLTRALAANDLLYPQVIRLPDPPAEPGAPGAAGVRFADHGAALAWLDAERANLVAVVAHTAAHGPAEAAWRLADALRGHLCTGMLIVDWQAVAQTALSAAETAGELAAQAAAHNSLATMDWLRGRHHEATEHFTAALALARAAGWAPGQTAALSNLGGLYADSGRLGEAAEVYTESLSAARAAGDLVGQATDLSNLGLIYLRQGRLPAAAEHCRQSAALNARTGTHSAARYALSKLGFAEYLLGDLDQAVTTLDQSLAIDREVGDRDSENATLAVLAAVHADAGRHRTALDIAATALTAAREVADQRTELEALIVQATVADRGGQHEHAVGVLHQAVDLAREIGMPYQQADALIRLADATRHTGQLAAAAGHLQQALALARQTGYRLLEGNAVTAHAAVDLARHRLDPAVLQAEQAVAIQAETGHRLGQARAHRVAAAALRAAGRTAEADTHEVRAHTLYTEVGAPAPELIGPVPASSCG